MIRIASTVLRRLVVLPATALLLSAMCLLPANWLSAQSTDAKPLWQQGISTWNGADYSSPSSVDTTPSAQLPITPILPAPAGFPAPNSESVKPYTVPVDPSLATDSTNFLPRGPYPAPASPVPAFDLGQAKPTPEVVTATPQETPEEKTVEQVAHQGPISQQVHAGGVIGEPPLHQQTISWYQYPWRWMTTGWDNHAEFGLDGSQGNAETLAMQVGLEMKRKTDLYTLAFDVDYRFANSRSVTTEDNGRFNVDYDRLLNDSPWSMFSKLGLEFDEFKAFDLRLNLNGGVGYHWVRNDRATLVTRFGAGASREFGAPIDDWTPEAVFGLEGEQQWNKYNKFKAKVDYFPAWEDFSDYRVVTDAGWEILLDDTDNLSLKLAVTDRYDSTPQGAKRNDFYYSMLLLFKF